jgi:putative transposase
MASCGGLLIRLPTFVRISRPKPHISFVTTIHTRRLSHYHSVGQATFVTWRLHDSLPPNRSFPAAIASGHAFLAMDRLLDHACTGPLFLRMPEVARMVVDSIQYRDQRTYHLHAFVVMPNHVHLLMPPPGEGLQSDAIA